MNARLKHEHNVAGTSLLKIARLLIAVAAAGDNRWEVHQNKGYKLSGEVAGIKLHLVEKGSILSLRGGDWMVDILCEPGHGDRFPIPASHGKKYPGANVDLYFPVIHGVRIKSADTFRHDMTILLLFISEWES